MRVISLLFVGSLIGIVVGIIFAKIYKKFLDKTIIQNCKNEKKLIPTTEETPYEPEEEEEVKKPEKKSRLKLKRVVR